MRGYSARDIAKMLDLSVSQVRSFARAGLVEPRRTPRGAYRFSFQDLVLLRTASGLRAARIPSRKIKEALMRLKERLPSGRPLTAVKISAIGDRVVVRDGKTVWQPESGQICFDFDVADLAQRISPLARQAADEAFESGTELGAEEWFELGCELEPAEPEHAREAYRRAVELNPQHTEAHINLGRLLHEAGQPVQAEEHYRKALVQRPNHPTALFNLGVSLEDRGLRQEALGVYEQAVEADPDHADAHYNLARLYQEAGKNSTALQHYNTYRRLARH